MKHAKATIVEMEVLHQVQDKEDPNTDYTIGYEKYDNGTIVYVVDCWKGETNHWDRWFREKENAIAEFKRWTGVEVEVEVS
jgi:hypothetical protein